MKIFVTGRHGQVARSLVAAAATGSVTVSTAGRPEFDLRDAPSVADEIARQRPTVVINAAAYTQVDNAESDKAEVMAVNANGAAHVARACAAHRIPLIHLSTDFVFDGTKPAPYVESDAAGPINVYGRSKLEGERQVAALCPQHLILRTSWVYSPFGSNFVLTMLRLAKDRSVISVVEDQRGNPTYAPHLANALLVIAQRVARDPSSVRWGIYHATGQGDTNWCDFARAIFAEAIAHGMPSAKVTPIATSAYPTPAKRPTNSRLDCYALQSAFGIKLPQWETGVTDCVAHVVACRPPAGLRV